MKPESDAWDALKRHAAAQLRDGFADRVVRYAHGPRPQAWRALLRAGAESLRPGFAEHVLRAARHAADLPSIRGHLALSAATAAVCMATVLFLHEQSVERADARNLAEWERMVDVADDDATMV